MLKLRFVASVLVATVAFTCATDVAASCSDRPGTPDEIRAEPISATAVRLHWRNTTNKAGGSDDMWFDISVRDGANQQVGKDITGGALQRGVKYHQQSAWEFTGLRPDTEYRFQMRARDEGGTKGCVSGQQSGVATTRTPSVQLDATCASYANTALFQLTTAKGLPAAAGCPVDGPRWTADRSAHYGFCLGTRAAPVIGIEQKAREDQINGCRARAATVAANTVTLRQNITTPSGTALGGWAELELHSDGTYFFRGHMHDSGAENYRFNVRAAFTTRNGVALVATKSGSVDGTSTLINRQRNFDWNDQGKNDLIRREWADVKSGQLQVAKAYKGAITGGLQSMMTDLLSFVVTDIAFGPQVAVVVFLSNEVTSVTGSGSVGGLVSVGGLAWAISPTYAVPIFVGARIATDALVKHRKITSEEYEFARIVFGNTLPPAQQITLTNLGGKDNRAFVFPLPDGSVQMNLTDAVYSAPGGPMRAVRSNHPVPGELFIHEMTHTWQLHNRKPTTYQWIFEGVQAVDYKPLAAHRSWSANDLEKQATIVNTWFRKHAVGWVDQADLRLKLESEPAVRDEYFKFIKDNVRLGLN
jgi:Fibronectin type III domain